MKTRTMESMTGFGKVSVYGSFETAAVREYASGLAGNREKIELRCDGGRSTECLCRVYSLRGTRRHREIASFPVRRAGFGELWDL